MGHTPEQQLKARQLRERYRLQRRRQALMVLSWCGAALAFAGIVLATVFLTRSCSKPDEDGPLVGHIVKQVEPTADQAQLIGSHSFRFAPWLLALDSARLYAASDSKKRALADVNYPLDTLAAYEIGEKGPLWELQLPEDAQAAGMFAAGGNVCIYAQVLAEPPYIEMRGYAGNDGKSRWSKRLEQADHMKAIQAGEQIVLNYQLPDGYRLTAFRGADGERSGLGLKLELKGLANSTIDQALAQEFELYSWDNVVGYSYYNVAGLADTKKGKLICENALDFYVYDMAYSAEAKRGLALTGGETGDSYVLWELARDGVPLELYQFLCDKDDILLRAAGEYAVLAFPVAEGAAAGKPMLVVLRQDFNTPRLEHVFEDGGVIADVVALPGTDDKLQLLVACDGGLDRDGWPTGKGELYLVAPEAAQPVQLLATLCQPVQAICQLKKDCLILCRGGQVYSYDAAQQDLVAVAKLKHELAIPQRNSDNTVLGLLSAPAAHWEGKLGQPLAADVFK